MLGVILALVLGNYFVLHARVRSLPTIWVSDYYYTSKTLCSLAFLLLCLVLTPPLTLAVLVVMGKFASDAPSFMYFISGATVGLIPPAIGYFEFERKILRPLSSRLGPGESEKEKNERSRLQKGKRLLTLSGFYNMLVANDLQDKTVEEINFDANNLLKGRGYWKPPKRLGIRKGSARALRWRFRVLYAHEKRRLAKKHNRRALLNHNTRLYRSQFRALLSVYGRSRLRKILFTDKTLSWYKQTDGRKWNGQDRRGKGGGKSMADRKKKSAEPIRDEENEALISSLGLDKSGKAK